MASTPVADSIKADVGRAAEAAKPAQPQIAEAPRQAGNQALLRAANEAAAAPPPGEEQSWLGPLLMGRHQVSGSDDPLEHDADRIARLLLAPPPRPREAPLPILEPGQGRLGTGGVPLPQALRRDWEDHLGLDLRKVRLHLDSSAGTLARQLRARAVTLGGDIAFAAGAFDPHSHGGRVLIAHELAHVVQQASAGIAAIPVRRSMHPVLQRAPDCAATTPAATPSSTSTAPPAGAAATTTGIVPDDAIVDSGIRWPSACTKNFDWWTEMHLSEVRPIRGLGPENQPRAWANRTRRIQQRIISGGTRQIEGARLDPDGVLGPRTYLAILAIAQNAGDPARADLQGLGLDLDSIAGGSDVALRARALARLPEVVVQTEYEVLGENAIRYYDVFYSFINLDDRNRIDQLLFGEPAPAGFRREDRIELLRRCYGSAGYRLRLTATLARLRRDFVYTTIDVLEASRADHRARLTGTVFAFVARNRAQLADLGSYFQVPVKLDEAAALLPPERQQDYRDVAALLPATGTAPRGSREIAAVLVAINLPELDPAQRLATVGAYLVEKAAREAAERAETEQRNQELARQHADALVRWITDTDTHHLLRGVRIDEILEMDSRHPAFFEMVLADLEGRSPSQFAALFDAVESTHGNMNRLVSMSLAGRYRDHPRVRRALAGIAATQADLRRHGYAADDANPAAGAVLLSGGRRVVPNQVCGDVVTQYLRDEDREQLRPAADRRLQSAIDEQSRAYIARVISGEETAATPEEAAGRLVQSAFTAAHINPDNDIEDVEWQESLRVLGVRHAPPQADGVERYEVQYERVERIVGGEAGGTPWVAVEGSAAWRSESEFELDMFWLSYSQTADVVLFAAKVVAIGAVVLVAWEVGALAALASAAGGTVPALAGIGLSMAIYALTHRRRTLEGLLLAGIEGYLAAVGFRVFSGAGLAVGRLVLPATIEQVTIRRLAAAWLLRHATVGALVGGTVGPASLFLQDLVRVLGHGGDFSPVRAYFTTAAWGMLLGAVFEVGGSALLAPLFRAADTTVLARLNDVVAAVRGREPPISPTQWFAESAASLGNFRVYLRTILDEALSDGIYNAARQKLEEAGAALLRAPGAASAAASEATAAWARGVRGTLQRQILDLAEIELTREGSNGLERLLRLGRARLDDDALATMLAQVRRNPERVGPWLRYLGMLDDTAAQGMLGANQIRPLADSTAVLGLSLRHPPTRIHAIMTARLNNSLPELEAFAVRTTALPEVLGDSVMSALHTRGTGVTPRSLLRVAEVIRGTLPAGTAASALDEPLLNGLRNILDGSAAGQVDAVLEVMVAGRTTSFLREAASLTQAELTATRSVIASYPAEQAAWGLQLPIARATTLLSGLSTPARGVMLDILAADAETLIAALGQTRVNAVLDYSVANSLGMRGSHLAALRTQMHDHSIIEAITYAAGNSGALRRLVRLGNAFGPLAAGMPAARPMAAGSIIIDTNIMIGIEKLMAGARLDPVQTAKYIQSVNALRRALGVPGDYVPGATRPTITDLLGANFDLRVGPVPAGEMIANEATHGTSTMIPQVGGLPVNRAHPNYAALIDELRRVGIGAAKGAPDRAVVADAIFAEVPAGRVPVLISGDDDIVIRLARSFATPTRYPAGAPGDIASLRANPAFAAGTFTVEIPITVGGTRTIHRLNLVF